MAEREQILADFQACTGLEDIEQCIAILEQYDWNLMPAVQNAMSGMMDSPASEPTAPPGEFAPPPYSEFAGFLPPFEQTVVGRRFSPQTQSDSVGTEAAGPAASAAAAAAVAFGSSSATGFASTSADCKSIRLLNFQIEYRERNVALVLPDSEPVGKIKELMEVEVGVPAARQQLCWVNKNDRRIPDEQLLRDLNLPKENSLFMLTPDVNQPTKCINQETQGNPNILERLSQTFTLNIHFTDKHRTFELNFPGSKTVQEVKSDVYALTDIPMRRQVWKGWPHTDSAEDDTMTLAGSAISFPCHKLEVASSDCTASTSAKKHVSTESNASSDMDVDQASDDDFEDAQESFPLEDDHFFESDVSGPRRPEPLMPENVTNQQNALECFAREFNVRYGECHPVFYIGKLEDAIRDALQCKARERKLLAIYLHHDGSIQANVFCSQCLCSESVVSYLAENFLTWAWDLSSVANRDRLLTMCTRHFGSVAATTVRNFKPDELPLLLLISRSRASNEVVGVIRGNTTLDELMMQLMHTVDVFNEQLKTEILEEDERDAREQVKQEQDDAYQMSLNADRAKAESRRQEEEERRQKEEVEQLKRLEEEQRKKEEEEEKEAISQSLAEQLPDEPPENCSEPVSTIRIRCPDGQQLVRRFLAQNPLQVLLNYVASKGFHINEFKVLTTFPRRDLTQEDPVQSLQSLKLFPQETVILEEK